MRTLVSEDEEHFFFCCWWVMIQIAEMFCQLDPAHDELCNRIRRIAKVDYLMSLVVRKPVFGVSDQVPHKPGCTAIEDG